MINPNNKNNIMSFRSYRGLTIFQNHYSPSKDGVYEVYNNIIPYVHKPSYHLTEHTLEFKLDFWDWYV